MLDPRLPKLSEMYEMSLANISPIIIRPFVNTQFAARFISRGIMLRRIILVILAAGIAYYSVQIYSMRDRIQFTQKAQASASVKLDKIMRLKFSLTSTDASLLNSCQQLFDNKDDVVTLNPDKDDAKKANLMVNRFFPESQIPDALELRKRLKRQGCLPTDDDVFAFEVLK